MIIDLHVHTSALSSDSSLDPEEAIKTAKSIGLDGICFTEHNKCWQADEIRRLSEKWQFLVLGGMEVDTVEGHVLVFGLRRNFEKIVRAHQLQQMSGEQGAVTIAAHPFKSFLVFGVSDLKLSPVEAAQRPIFRWVDAVEGWSGKVAEKENLLAQEVARILRLNITGGSDAHSSEAIGRCVTVFENEIRNEAELILELKKGSFRAACLSQEARP